MREPVVVVDSIGDVPGEDWRALTRNQVYGQYGWLRVIETSVREARNSRYFLLYDDGRLTAAAAAYVYSGRSQLGRLGDLLYGRLSGAVSRIGAVPDQFLYCGPIIGHGRHVFWDRSSSPDAATGHIHSLLTEIDKWARDRRLTLVFGRIPEDEQELRLALRAQGYAESETWPVSYIDVQWEDWEAYVSSLRDRGRNLPTKVRREAGATEKYGIRMRRLIDYRDKAGEISELFGATSRKYNVPETAVGPDFIESLAEHHGRNAVVTISESGNPPRISGCALLLTAGDSASGPLIGVLNDPDNRRAFTYFNLAFYEPIRFCIEHGIRRVYFGAGLRRTKWKRGCLQSDVFVYVRAPGKASQFLWTIWFFLHRRWIARKSRRNRN